MRADASIVWFMKRYVLAALLALIFILPARAQLEFSDSLRISLLTCSQGPDAYERFGHTALRIQDLKSPEQDVTFHYGVFSFNAPNFIYRFVKGETDYQLGALHTSHFIEGYRRRGLGMVEQTLRLDSAQCQEMVRRLLINYRPENRTYRYSYFFDNCATRPYNLLNLVSDNTIVYDSAWSNAITLREMVQGKTGRDNWLDFGIALAVAGRADQQATYREQMFLPEYLMNAMTHAQTQIKVGDGLWLTPIVAQESVLLEMDREVSDAIAAPDPIAPNTTFAIVLLIALAISGAEYAAKRKPAGSKGKKQESSWALILAKSFDSLMLLAVGVTGCIVWFLNFLSLHPAVDHNLNCLWLLPTHVIMACLLWVRKLDRVCTLYFGITFAAIIVYVVMDWLNGQYCPNAFLLILATLLLRSFMHFGVNSKQ